jgi:hypothetical protein
MRAEGHQTDRFPREVHGDIKPPPQLFDVAAQGLQEHIFTPLHLGNGCLLDAEARGYLLLRKSLDLAQLAQSTFPWPCGLLSSFQQGMKPGEQLFSRPIDLICTFPEPVSTQGRDPKPAARLPGHLDVLVLSSDVQPPGRIRIFGRI